MEITKRNNNRFDGLFSPSMRVSTLLDNLINDFTTFGPDRMTDPSVNVKETETLHQIQLSAPGYKKENFNINIDNDILVVSNVHTEEKIEEKSSWTRKEFKTSSFSRSFQLHDGLNVDDISAKYEDGILYIDIPKKENQTKKTRNIEIK
jgi:HSP20 family protein